jgi:hypothetical protein
MPAGSDSNMSNIWDDGPIIAPFMLINFRRSSWNSVRESKRQTPTPCSDTVVVHVRTMLRSSCMCIKVLDYLVNLKFRKEIKFRELRHLRLITSTY